MVDCRAKAGKQRCIKQESANEVHHKEEQNLHIVDAEQHFNETVGLRRLCHDLGGINCLGRRHCRPYEAHTQHRAGYAQQHRPDGNLREAHKRHAKYLAQHQLKRLAAAHYHLNNAVGLFLYHAVHNHCAIHQHKEVRQHRQGYAHYHGNVGRRGFLAAAIAPLDGAHIHLNITFFQNLLEALDAVGTHLGIGERLAHAALQMGNQRRANGTLAVDKQLVGSLNIAWNNHYGIQLLAFLVVELASVAAFGLVVVFKIKLVVALNSAAVASGFVDNGNRFLVVGVNHLQQHWYAAQQNQQKRHEQRHHYERLLAHNRHIFALKNQQKTFLVHCCTPP